MTTLHLVRSLNPRKVSDRMTMLTPKSAGALLPSQDRAALRRSGVARSLLAGAALMVSLLCSPKVDAQTTPTPQPVIVADFNHDGIPDVLVPSSITPTATIAFGSVPYGSFSTGAKAVTFPAACTSFPQGSLVVGDFNGDGFPDIAYFCGNTIGVTLGNGDGTFGAVKAITGLSSQLAVAGDFNNDGKLDLAIIGVGGDTTVTQNIQFFAGKGDGTFGAAIISTLPQLGYSAPVVADIDGDGYPDIVLGLLATNTDNTPSVNIFGNNKDGTFGVLTSGVNNASVSANVTVSAASSILAGNFFGNDVNDLIVPDIGTNAKLFLLQNTSSPGKFSFNDPSTFAVAGLKGAAPGFFSGTGATDLFLVNGTSISAYDNDGSGNFAADYDGLTVAATSPLFAIADANLDGYSDIYTATSTDGALQLAVNVTTGSATATSQTFPDGAIGTIHVSATWNGDANLLASTATGQQIVLGAVTVAGLTSSLNPSTVGQSVTFTATFVPLVPVDGSPTGAITLTDGTTTLASGTLDGTGSFSYTTTALTQATHLIKATYAGDNYFAASVSPVLSQVVNHAPAVASNLTWATPAAIVYGTALSGIQLNATASDATGAAIPGTFVYTPAAGAVLDAGANTLSVTFTPTDLLSFLPAIKTVTLTVTQATPVLTWMTPATIPAGVPLSATQLDASVVGITGAALPGTFTYTPASGTVLPSGTQTLSVTFVPSNAADYTNVSGSVKLMVAANVGATITAPPTTPPGSQPTVTITLTEPYPVDLNVTLNLSFASSTTPQITDNQQLQLACQNAASNCVLNATNTTLTFTVPANTTTVPVVLLQAGTIAGTITIPITLTAGGVDVTPSTLAPAVIVVPPAVPSVSGMTLTRSGNQLTVVMHGFSNTREVVNAKFHFTAAPGATLGTEDLTLPADTIFNTDWFDTAPSEAYGSTFTYTQIFSTSDDAASIGSVDATLTNTVGPSTSTTAK